MEEPKSPEVQPPDATPAEPAPTIDIVEGSTNTPAIVTEDASLLAQLLDLLLPLAGERGETEGAVEVLQRIIRERNMKRRDLGLDSFQPVDTLSKPPV